ncbi:sodium-coupled monocarboxylate transporter 1 [Latimeria chalumnae]|uniref:sodium-coupled monocarboxylate transporter 1 n=1 Tax=Latimeria chalumnae TaxID=7897 RepID=UPI0003C191C0|nr:PREDICTED: sodium-coupled monocarboxylate transporter 1-like [Latimeria chalumnae]|eukprot:XP_005988523.1 PREDICTED: sodium-coupled monocarboxylate transporter 1-like [Latimeria chalumnae]
MNLKNFSVWDYVVFAVILLVAAGIGIYQALAGRGERSSGQFLLGGRQMTAVPVALSLTASFMSGITVIGTPAEAYRFGIKFWLFAFSYAIMSVISAEVFLPLFYRLGITSTYEYLEMRFNRYVRLIGTSMFILQTILYTGMVIYAPALALNQITGLDLWGVIIVTGVVCTIYCSVGGLKAVVWTDVFQMIVMLSGFLAVIIQGSIIQGGMSTIWNISYHGGRLDVWDFDPDPLKRHTFWTIVIGGSLLWASIYAINQSQVQRYISCKSQLQAKLSLYINMVGLWITVSLAMLAGLTMYSIYHTCDPLTANWVGASDQLLPYLVMDILGQFPGVPGLFVAAAYSGTLSTVSSSVNALATVTAEDFIKPYKLLTDQKLSWILKGLSVLYGAVCIAMAGLSSLMGSILQAALSIFGIIGGPLLGLFVLGMFFPCGNAIGGLSGLLVGLVITLWVGIGSQIYPPLPERTLPLPLSTAGCFFNSTQAPVLGTESPWTTTGEFVENDSRPPLADTWYSLSYLYFCPLGLLISLILGIVVSLLTGGRKQTVDPNLLVIKTSSLCRSCISETKDPYEEYEVKQKTTEVFASGKENLGFSFMETDNQEKQEKVPTTYS